MFPTFSWYSTPLLLLYIWGLVFSFLLFRRYYQQRNISDLLLAGVLLIHTYGRTTYTIGFMAWYDNYPNTKINYFLIDATLLLGPLIYFYVKSLTKANFKFLKQDLWHFFPQAIYMLYRIVIYLYDVNQEGFDEVQNGQLFSNLSMHYVGLFISILADISLAIYLILSIQMERNYKKKIKELFSNLFNVELRWLRNFLAIFSISFITMLVLSEIDENITKMDYKDFWWGHLAAAISLIYLGIYGYFLDIKKLHRINIDAGAQQLQINEKLVQEKLEDQVLKETKRLHAFMETQKPYLNSSLTLSKLATAFELNPNELSQIINKGMGMNFNDFVNSYRVNAVKQSIQAGKADQFTLLTIAYEAGFNSKATFNRTFKKFSQESPSEFLKRSTKK